MTERDFRSAFFEHKDAIYRLAWRITNSSASAEDITQDVLLFLLRQPDRFDSTRGRLRSFLLGVTRNLAWKKLSEQQRWEDLDDALLPALEMDPARAEIADLVGAALQALPLAQREALVLAEYEGFSLAEIAETVGADVGTVKSRLHRARENMRRLLAPLKESRSNCGTVE